MPGDEVVDGGGWLRRFGWADIVGDAAMNQAIRRDVQALEKAQDFLIAQLHAVAGTVRPRIEERRGVDRLDVKTLRRQQHLHQRELVVDLVVSVGVEHDTQATGRRGEELEAG